MGGRDVPTRNGHIGAEHRNGHENLLRARSAMVPAMFGAVSDTLAPGRDNGRIAIW